MERQYSNKNQTKNVGPPFPMIHSMPYGDYLDYGVDFLQRSVLFWDVMRRRGNQYLEHAAKPVQHVLQFEFEAVMDGRELDRPVNYGLVRIVPPDGVEVDDDRRPFVVVDPRAGHGPGIGGFKPDSEVGAILNAGFPCYFIGFLAEPVPGQTIEDIGRAEVAFLERVAELHPSPEGKPCVIANCQAGWAMMMLAAVRPDTVGPLLIAGSPLSYWAGVRGENPMRYTGGLLGGTWLTALSGDLGNGIFDGAHLVANFENLNPANTFWGKHYNLWSKIDTEAERYLDFEKWWGGHILLGAEEMQFIADELFVGNRLAQGEIRTSDGIAVDLRNIRSPIVIFCSHGDNITPPLQALQWVLELYEGVDEIRAYGQTIVYSLHEDIGHLGIFVSGKVAKKEHDQFTQNMDLIDVLPPGLYEVVIREKTQEDANAELAYGDYIVTFENRTLDDIRALGDQGTEDDPAFEAVARFSEINKGLYRSLMAPWVQNFVTEQSAKLLREMHPARLQYSLFSDRNPVMGWVAAAADSVRTARQPVREDNPVLALERHMSKTITEGLDHWRDARDQAQEQLFFNVYGSDLVQALVGLKSGAEEKISAKPAKDPARIALVNEKLRDLEERIAEGGWREAWVRALLYVGIPEGRIEERGFGALKLIREQMPPDQRISLAAFKMLVRDQFFILLHNEEEALATLSDLLPKDRKLRQDLYEKLLVVAAVKGPLSEERKNRLQIIAELFGLDGAGTETGKAGKDVSAANQPTVPSTRVRRRHSVKRA